MKTKINYIVAFYYGNRMNFSYSISLNKNRFFMFDEQIKAIQEYGQGIDLVTFVFNLDNLNEKDFIVSEIKKKDIKFEYEIYCRKNEGASYGAWDEVIKKNINDFDYFFVSEDDFVPATKNFYHPFIERFVDKIAYVCMFANQENKYKGVAHAAISNGMFSANACRQVLNNQKKLFKIYTSSHDYNSFYATQFEFFEYFIDEGFFINDILDKYSSPFMNSRTETITIYGNANNPVLIVPVSIPSYTN